MGKPKIRFKGYTEDWEQHKVSELCSISTGKSNTQDKVEDGEYPFYVRSPIIERSTKYLYDEEAVLTVGDGVGTGKVFHYVNGKYDLHQRCYRMYDFTNVLNARYFYHTFSKFFYKRVMAMTAKTSVDSVRLEMIADMEIPCPDIKEQEQIGAFFTNLDHLITLHQRKCEETKKLKKYMLQKMFPKDGTTVPEIRFSGFTEDWEQRKLGEVFEQTTNFVNLDEGKMELWSLTVEDGLTPKSERYNREFLVKKDTNFKEVRPGDIVYNPMNMTLGAVGYNGMAKSVAVSGYYTTMVANAGYDSYYINTWLKSPYAISLYKTFATGSLKEKQRVQFPTLSIIPTVFPGSEEQKKIGLFFERLDTLITLHQRKCDELQNIKKFMLQNMFV